MELQFWTALANCTRQRTVINGLYGIGPNTNGELGLGHSNPVTSLTLIADHVLKAIHDNGNTMIMLKDTNRMWHSGHCVDEIDRVNLTLLNPYRNGNVSHYALHGGALVWNSSIYGVCAMGVVPGSLDTPPLRHGNGGGDDLVNRPTGTKYVIGDKFSLSLWKDSAQNTHVAVLESDGNSASSGLYGNSELTALYGTGNGALVQVNDMEAKNGVAYKVADGVLSCLGVGVQSQTSYGVENQTTPLTIATGVKKVFPGVNNCFILKTDGNLYAAGLHNRALGIGAPTNNLVGFTLVGSDFKDVSSNGLSTLFLKTNGDLYYAGNGNPLTLDTVTANFPILIETLIKGIYTDNTPNGIETLVIA